MTGNVEIPKEFHIAGAKPQQSRKKPVCQMRLLLFILSLVTCYLLPVSAWAVVSVSGTAYQNNETTALVTTAYNVALRVNGGTASTTTTSTVDGTFNFSGVTAAVSAICGLCIPVVQTECPHQFFQAVGSSYV